MVFITKSHKETEEKGSILAKNLKAGTIIALTGDLGSGKTTFIKGLAKGLGVKNTVTSPTFLIIKKYDIKRMESDIRIFYHIDCYRIENEQKLQFLGIEEILKDNSAVAAIEWPDKIGKLLPGNALNIKFEWLSENERKISIED